MINWYIVSTIKMTVFSPLCNQNYVLVCTMYNCLTQLLKRKKKGRTKFVSPDN